MSLHTANIVAHVLLATMAMILGGWQLVGRKGDGRHRRRGRWFLAAMIGAVGTAAMGLVAFEFRAFLSGVTLLAAYWTFTGYRTLRTRADGPGLLDAVASVAAIGTAVVLIVRLQSIQLPWAPSVTYSTLGALATAAVYDLVRFAFPRRWFASLWLYEHVVRMIGAYSATLSAFAGTVLVAWQPYSQLVPSIVCTGLLIGFLIGVRQGRYRRAPRSRPAELAESRAR